ncbi:MAG: DUF2147 domain-containing protein [Bacteroidetes bacterium]|nr:DUF2147 domain-containing protein [Bacteroidota bacterium]
MKAKTWILLLSFLVSAGWSIEAMAQKRKADDVLGTYLNEERSGKIEVFKKDGKYFGKIIWLRDPIDRETGKPKLDKLNPDPNMRKNPVLNMLVLKNFVFDGTDEWEDGTIYDPKNGKTYSCYVEFESVTRLKIRGYIGISLLGRTTYWNKVTK